MQLGDEDVGSIATSAPGQERGGLGVRVGAEAEHGRREAERLGEIRQRRDADAAADEERPLDVEPEAVAERAEDVDPRRRARARRAPPCPGRPDR